MFELSLHPLETLNLRQGLIGKNAGAFVSFEGRVRFYNEGKTVRLLEYEAYELLCANEARKIFEEVYKEYDILTTKCVHRVGRVKPDEISVWVGAIAEHRDAAFKACRYIIDQVKFRLPIWKKEHYEDGDSGWLANEPVSLKMKSRITVER